MIAVLCALVAGACFHFSTGLGGAWPLAWLAPLPILWLAYGETRCWRVAVAAFSAFLLGQLNLFEAYSVIGLPLAIMIVVQALAFAACVMFGRWTARRLTAPAAALAFPSAWTAWEYIVTMASPHGAVSVLANSQVGAPVLIQAASLFGLWVISFLICAVASLLALAHRRAAPGLALLAVVLFSANLGFGLLRIDRRDDAGPSVRVAAVADDRLGKLAWSADRAHAVAATRAYADKARNLARAGASYVVLPEKFAFLTPGYRAEALAPLQAVADETGATLIAGFDDKGTHANEALVLRPHTAPFAYAKRHLIPGLEGGDRPGARDGLFESMLATAICKDMDFPQTLRADAAKEIGLLFVPAWDFDSDGWSHGRIAILRGVEGGYGVVRAAQHGLVTISDLRGVVLAKAASATGGEVIKTLSPGPGATLYTRIGDVFAWLCGAGALILTLAGVLRRPLPLTSPRSSV
jgi:apolipoprotein N-acyltransferase